MEVVLALYGLPESSERWNTFIVNVLVNGGYSQCPHEPCMFRRSKTGGQGRVETSVITIHVDDCLHTYRGERIRSELYAILKNGKVNEPTVQVLKEAQPISHLGVSIRLNEDRSLHLSQPAYVSEILELYPPPKTYSTPCDENFFHKKPMEGEMSEPVTIHEYLSKLMKIMYLATRTRPDLLPVMSGLSTKMKSPVKADLQVLERVVGYIKYTRHFGMHIRVTSMILSVYADAGHGQHLDLRSHTGIQLYLGELEFMVLSKSYKQKQVAKSSTEAELIAAFESLDYALKMRAVLHFLQYKQVTTIVYQDNTSAITIAYMGRLSSSSNCRYMQIKYNYFKSFLEDKTFAMRYLPREGMIADYNASPRVGAPFKKMIFHMMGETFEF